MNRSRRPLRTLVVRPLLLAPSPAAPFYIYLIPAKPPSFRSPLHSIYRSRAFSFSRPPFPFFCSSFSRVPSDSRRFSSFSGIFFFRSRSHFDCAIRWISIFLSFFNFYFFAMFFCYVWWFRGLLIGIQRSAISISTLVFFIIRFWLGFDWFESIFGFGSCTIDLVVVSKPFLAESSSIIWILVDWRFHVSFCFFFLVW